MRAGDRIACALDTDSGDQAVDLVNCLKHNVGVFKVGLELLSAEGPGIVARLYAAGARRIFYDAKLFDIPNTVAGAMRGITAARPWCVTVHAAGGSAILAAAVESAKSSAERRGVDRPKIIAVTLLTSISQETLTHELGVRACVEDHVARMALMAQDAGCDGVVTSPREISAVRAAIPDQEFLIITPGIRPAGSAAQDQSRTMTPGQAIKQGASLLVIGRPITASANPVLAAESIATEIASAL